ncbi:MAG: hypothetical protein HY000_05230 [Planctomycetes bacterium]|nr:hypothetical protein [Planctomycetota bacterium]
MDPAIAKQLCGHGIYAFGSLATREILYVGKAGGNAQTIYDRLWRHRVKLTASNFGTRVDFPKLWQSYAKERFAATRGRDDLSDIVLALMPCDRTSVNLKDIEAYCCARFQDVLGYRPRLNGGMSASKECFAITLPGNIVEFARPVLGFQPVGSRARKYQPNSMLVRAAWHESLCEGPVHKTDDWWGHAAATLSARPGNAEEVALAEEFVRKAYRLHRSSR